MIDPTTFSEIALSAFTAKKLGLDQTLNQAARGVGAKLFGPTLAIPQAWLNDKAQAIRDRTEMRSGLSKLLLDVVGRDFASEAEASASQIIAMLENYTVAAARCARAFDGVLDHLHARREETGSRTGEPRDDFINRWKRLVEDVDDDAMRDLLARILAGEIIFNETFSLKTLRIASEMDTQTARFFEQTWALSVGEYFARPPEYEQSPGIEMLETLREAGLVSTTDMTLEPENGIVYVGEAAPGHPMLRLTIDQEVEDITPISITLFSGAGRELGTVLTVPDREANLRRYVEESAKEGWVQAELLWLEPPGRFETIWRQGS